MADESPLSWVFELFDKVSSPAQKVSDALGHTSKAFDHAGEHSHSFLKQMLEFEVIKEVGHMFMEVGEKVFEMGKEMIEAASYAEKLHLSFETMLGSGKEATEVMEQLEVMAAKMGVSGKQLTGEGSELLSAGFSKDRLTDLLAASHDIAALNPTNAGAASSAVSMFAHIQDTGKLTARAMMQLKQLHISVPEVTANLAKAYGVKTDQVKKLIEKGKIDAAHGISAIEEAIAKKGGTSALGDTAAKFGHTAGGMMEVIKNIPETIFAAVSDTRGFDTFKGFLENIISLAGPGSKFQKGITEALGSVLDAMFGDLSGPQGADKFKSILDSVVKVVKTIPENIAKARIAFEEFWPVVKTAGEILLAMKGVQLATSAVTAIMAAGNTVATGSFWSLNAAMAANPVGLIVAGIAALGFGIYELVTHWTEVKKFFSDVATSIGDFFVKMWDKVVDYTKHAAKRVWEGFTSGLGDGNAADNAARFVPDTIIKGTKDGLQIHSPSKVFENLGLMTAHGFAIGVDKGSSRIDSSMGSAISLPTGGASSSFSGGSKTANVNITVNAGGGADGNDIATQIRMIMPGALANAFEQMAMEAGAA